VPFEKRICPESYDGKGKKVNSPEASLPEAPIEAHDLGSRTAVAEREFHRGLTFDMRGGRQPAKPDVGRPLDGRVRAQFELAHSSCLAIADHIVRDTAGL
jgi:hypothetical protein